MENFLFFGSYAIILKMHYNPLRQVNFNLVCLRHTGKIMSSPFLYCLDTLLIVRKMSTFIFKQAGSSNNSPTNGA